MQGNSKSIWACWDRPKEPARIRAKKLQYSWVDQGLERKSRDLKMFRASRSSPTRVNTVHCEKSDLENRWILHSCLRMQSHSESAWGFFIQRSKEDCRLHSRANKLWKTSLGPVWKLFNLNSHRNDKWG